MNRTNYQWWFDAIGGQDHNIALWSLFHGGQWYELEDLRAMPWWNAVDKIFLIGAEGHTGAFTQADARIWVWDSRYLPDQPRFHSFYWWWWQTVEVERYQNAFLKLTDPRIASPRYHFECVMTTRDKLCRKVPHRRFPVEFIQQSDLRQQCWINQTGDWIPGTDRELSDLDAYSTLERMQPYGHGDATAAIVTWIPYHIYNQAWFSVLAESRHDYNFFTEKTAKLLLSRRLFVAFGAKHLLRELRAMGFQTFGSVIDESYDDVSDDPIRWHMATEQIQQICQQDPQAVYEKVLPVLEHNRQHLLAEDLIDRAQRQMIAVLDGKYH